MPLSLKAKRVAMRCAYVALRAYWFLARPNVVGVKCIVLSGDDVLLVRHTYGRRNWDLPGGTVKRREVPLDAARREMNEELGRRIEDWEHLGVLFTTSDHHRDNVHLFQADLGDRRLDINLMELAEADWFPRDRLPPDVGPFVGRIMARAALPTES
jgi:8-oxo-dGTP pyrophosphatase MutT (NUDIX family)